MVDDLLRQTYPGQPKDEEDRLQAWLRYIVKQLDDGTTWIYNRLRATTNDVRTILDERAMKAKAAKRHHKEGTPAYMMWLSHYMHGTQKHLPEQEHPLGFQSRLSKIEYFSIGRLVRYTSTSTSIHADTKTQANVKDFEGTSEFLSDFRAVMSDRAPVGSRLRWTIFALQQLAAIDRGVLIRDDDSLEYRLNGVLTPDPTGGYIW